MRRKLIPLGILLTALFLLTAASCDKSYANTAKALYGVSTGVKGLEAANEQAFSTVDAKGNHLITKAQAQKNNEDIISVFRTLDKAHTLMAGIDPSVPLTAENKAALLDLVSQIETAVQQLTNNGIPPAVVVSTTTAIATLKGYLH